MKRFLAALLSLLLVTPASAGWLDVPPTTLLNQPNTWSALQTFSAGLTVSGGNTIVGNFVSSNIMLGSGLVNRPSLSNTHWLLNPDTDISWSATANVGYSSSDLIILRDAANILGLRNGTNAQTFRLYETYTDASNYSRLSISAPSDGPITFASEAAGTGGLRNFQFSATTPIMTIMGTGTNVISLRLSSPSDGWGEIKFTPSSSTRVLALGADNTATILYLLSTGAVGINTATPAGLFSRGIANGQQLSDNYVTELTTIAAAATTDTVIQIPLNVVVRGCSTRVTTVIPTAATFTVTGTTSGTQFDVAGGVSTAAGTTDKGINNTPYRNGAAQTIRITPNLTPADNTGRVRVTCWYEDVTPATS